MADAACKEFPNVNFFPGKSESAAAALAVCARCLVLDECRTFAIRERIEHGVWGGTTGTHRIRVLFRRPVEADAS